MRSIFCSVMVVSGLFVPTALGGTYTYSMIDSVDSTFTSGFSTPSINASGVVAYSKALTTNGSDRGLFLSTSATPLFTTVLSPYSLAIGSQPSLNNNGVVAIVVGIDGVSGASGIVTASQPSGTNLLYQTSTGGWQSFGNPWINNNGVVAFAAATSTIGSPLNGIFKGTGTTYTTLMDETTALLIQIPQRPSINDAGTVAFLAVTPATSSSVIAKADGQDPVTMADITGPFATLFSPSINNNNLVAFRANYDAFTGTQPLMRQIGSSTTTTLMDVSGPFSTMSQLSINDNGNFVFSGLLDGGSAFGVYDGSDPATNKVLIPGDVVFGKTVTVAAIQPDALNNSGQVAMLVTFTDGSRGIVVATPTPEPASILLAAPGLLLLLRRRKS